MQFDSPLIPGRLVQRYKRFLADIIIENNKLITAHTANTGSMTGCADPGQRVWVRNTANPNRKYPYSWELSETPEGKLIGIHTAWANKLVAEAIESGVISELEGYAVKRFEPPNPLGKGRFDLALSLQDGSADCLVEVKNVTAMAGLTTAQFPDAVSERGQRHLADLIRLAEAGREAALVFCVQREDVDFVTAADEIDANYGRLLRQAMGAGVRVLAYGACVSTKEVVLRRALKLAL
ncbi:MAG: DNA/RNA nuclease SfsA [Gammaproteobacteria bacterium]|nr:DNA/RNA nuclease SfsA [Gammaproteobacteria bacterium]MDH5691542.1 DNA/RNA nuclease SfsA [Gammaproteobacteria bacterium]